MPCRAGSYGERGRFHSLPRGIQAWLTYECLMVGRAEEADISLSGEKPRAIMAVAGWIAMGADAATCTKIQVPGATSVLVAA